MIKEEKTHEVHEVSQSDLMIISGGGEGDDLAYNVTYAFVTLTSAFWIAKYGKFIYDKIAK